LLLYSIALFWSVDMPPLAYLHFPWCTRTTWRNH
jgi:hypothetical protein